MARPSGQSGSGSLTATLTSFRLTQDEDVHNDPRDGRPHQEAKSRVDVEVGGEGGADPKHGLDGQAGQDHRSAAVPAGEGAHSGGALLQ